MYRYILVLYVSHILTSHDNNYVCAQGTIDILSLLAILCRFY